MLDAAELSDVLKRLLWSQAFKMACDLYNISSSTADEKSKYEKFNNQMPRWCKQLVAFGEVGIVRKGGKPGHLNAKGFEGIMVGYCDDHAEGVFEMLNLSTNRISTSRDVKWMHKTYGSFMRGDEIDEQDEDTSITLVDHSTESNGIADMGSNDDNSSDVVGQMLEINEEIDSEPQKKESALKEDDDSSVETSQQMDVDNTRKTRSKTRESKIPRPHTQLSSDRILRSRKRAAEIVNMVIEAGDADDLSELAFATLEADDINSVFTLIDELNEQFEASEYGLFSAVDSAYLEPENYRAMLGRPPGERDKWLEGCQQEINNFNKRQVWEIINKTDVPANRKLIGNKWVFKRKRITMEHRSRLVALGYTQIPGLDFTDNFSPVVGDVTLRISLIVWIVLDLDIDQMDV